MKKIAVLEHWADQLESWSLAGQGATAAVLCVAPHLFDDAVVAHADRVRLFQRIATEACASGEQVVQWYVLLDRLDSHSRQRARSALIDANATSDAPSNLHWVLVVSDQQQADEWVPLLLEMPRAPQSKALVLARDLKAPLSLERWIESLGVSCGCGDTDYVLQSEVRTHVDELTGAAEPYCPACGERAVWKVTTGAADDALIGLDAIVIDDCGDRPIHPLWAEDLRRQAVINGKLCKSASTWRQRADNSDEPAVWLSVMGEIREGRPDGADASVDLWRPMQSTRARNAPALALSASPVIVALGAVVEYLHEPQGGCVPASELAVI